MPTDHDEDKSWFTQTDKRAVILGIVASLAATLIIVLAQPLFGWMSRAAVALLGGVAGRIIDEAFHQATGSNAEAMLFVLIMLLVGSIAIKSITTRIAQPFKIRRRKSDQAAGIDPKAAEEERLRIASEKELRGFKFIPRLVAALVLGCLEMFWLIMLLGIFFVPIQASTTFKLRMLALSPVLTTAERAELRASWALLDSRSDYERLMAELERRAREHQRELPERLI